MTRGSQTSSSWPVKVNGKYLAYFDQIHSLTENQLVVFCDDTTPRYVTTSCVLDYNTVAVGDKFGSISIETRPGPSPRGAETRHGSGEALSENQKRIIGIEGEEPWEDLATIQGRSAYEDDRAAEAEVAGDDDLNSNQTLSLSLSGRLVFNRTRRGRPTDRRVGSYSRAATAMTASCPMLLSFGRFMVGVTGSSPSSLGVEKRK
ncbi:unnamed protein product [Heligmosomoides polygyrus]|uniref:CPSF_A domain-containing protein n=1 Tax=Heligmosomoides polygyrus TaxID=6339 RepID=A0A3P8AYK7_HELPZ|nr:unnamed protein product [Heligmosomoides polygyrus]